MNQSYLYEKALKRPRNYESLPSQRQWGIDKKLGILDWDGSCFHWRGKMCDSCKAAYHARKTPNAGPLRHATPLFQPPAPRRHRDRH